MKKSIIVTLSTVMLFACGDGRQQTKPFVYDEKPIVKQSETDTADASVKEEIPKTNEEPSATISSPSSTHSQRSNNYDNMRGFDPASEDDMDDNGMSRYMVNYDDEGWD